jgi:hypothetical protein
MLSKVRDGVGGHVRFWNRSSRGGCRSPRGAFRNGDKGVIGIHSTIFTKVLPDGGLEIAQDRVVDSEFPVQIAAHLPLHLVDLPQRKHPLCHDPPGLVRVRIVAYYLGSDHESRNEETVAGRTASSRETSL